MASDKPGNSFSHFTNKDCAFFPCHHAADKDSFNCLFCFCPLYALGEGCGGSFSYTPEGVKDCSSCLLPHEKGGYDYIRENIGRITDMARRDKSERDPA